MGGQEKTPRLLDQVRQVMRLHHYSLHTERAYLDWIRRYGMHPPKRSAIFEIALAARKH